MDSVIEQVKNTIETYNMIHSGDGVLVAVSGGADSICLLHILNKLKERYNLKLYVAHVNHMLRGEASENDARYVEEFSNKLGIPVYIKKVDIQMISKKKRVSEEVAGRQERYSFFSQIAKQVGAHKIAVAQNKNDQAETMLMRLIRGTGLDGLSSIKPIRKDGIIRPLLDVERVEIEQYCSRNQLLPRMDETNLEPIYTRNKIRLDLIPYIKKEHNPNFVQAAAITSKIIREDNDFIEQYVYDIMQQQIIKIDNTIEMPIEFLMKQHIAIRKRILRKAIEMLKGNVYNIEYKHIEEILQMLNKKHTGLSLDLPSDMGVRIAYNKLYILNHSSKRIKKFIYPLEMDESNYCKELDIAIKMRVIEAKDVKNISTSSFVKMFDYHKVNAPIYIRNRLPGDRFVPLGMEGTKKLKDFFIDLKVPRHQRDYVPLLATADDILWVIGYRINEKFKCSSDTDKALVIEIIGGGKYAK